MSRIVALAVAAGLLGVPSLALGQAAPKPVSRADFIKTIDNSFAAIDSNHDGSASQAEMTAEQQRELEIAKRQITQTMMTRFKQLDTNKDGQLTFQEFNAAAPPIRTVETPQQLLQKLDTNRDGKVSPEEYRAPQVAKFNKADANHDGVVTPAEAKAAAGQK